MKFLPGNHDEGSWGRKARKKIIGASEYLKKQDSIQVQTIPVNGCPGPVKVEISPKVILVAYDSQWWLLRGRKKDNYDDCPCKDELTFLDSLVKIRDTNKGKIIIIASHHPFQSYGNHGGKFPSDKLIPRMLQGLRITALRQDIKNKKNQHMRESIENVFAKTDNII